MSNSSGGARGRLFASAATAVLASLAASSAHAADTSIDQIGTPAATASADLTINSSLTNHGQVGASVVNAQGKVGQAGLQTGTSNTVSQNTIAAKAVGNNNQGSIPALDASGAAGAALLNTSVNAPDEDDVNATGVITSTVVGSGLSIALDDFQSGSAANSGNTISAEATLNSASSSISGALPSEFVSATPGASTLDYPDGVGNQFSAGGTVVVSTVQQAVGAGQGAGSHAAVAGNEVALDLTSTADNSVASGPVLDDNKISATFKGNAAHNTADIQAGGDPQFAGSAVVSNLQVNAADAASDTDAAAAHNVGSTIAATIGSADFVNTLNGSLSVAGNTIASAATGNETLGVAPGEAGNRLLLGDGMAISGAGTANSGADIAYDGGGVVSSIAADLVIHNSQGNAGSAIGQSLNSVTEDAAIIATVQALDGGSTSVSSNRIAATTNGNNASNAITTGRNTGAFAATVAVANQQTNDNASIDALTSNTRIGAIVGDGGVTSADTLAVTSNSSAASAYGNQVAQSVALEANAITLGPDSSTLRGGAGPDGHVVTSGAATVSNLQSLYDSSVSSRNEGSTIALTSNADDTTASTLTVGGNTQEAVALGSSSDNQMSLSSGTSVGSGAGIANAQIADSDSPVSASLDGASAAIIVAGDLGENVGGSTSLAGNLQRAIGYGNSTNNQLGVSANEVTVAIAEETDRASTINFDPAASNGLVFDNAAATAPLVNAAYGVLNDQSIQAGVSASATGGGMTVSIGADAEDASSIANRDNAYVAAAYGNDAKNGATITPGQIDTGIDGGFASIANVTNVQTVGGDAVISAQASGGDVVRTDIAESLDNSSVTTSGNTIQALAYGNRSTSNSIAVEATNIDTAPAGGDAVRGGAAARSSSGLLSLTTDASFSVQNAQSGEGSVTATQLTGATQAAQVRVEIGDAVVNSSVAADENTSAASATSNSAVNGLAIKANGLATTSAVQNFQTSGADLSASIGLPGVAGSPGSDGTDPAPFTFTATGSLIIGVYDSENDVWTITSGVEEIDPIANNLSDEQVSALLSSGVGWSQSGGPGTTISRDSTGRIVSSEVYNGLTEGPGATLNGTVPGAPPTPPTASVPNSGGVTVAIGEGISGSSVSVTGNHTNGSVTGNSAANSLSINATNVSDGSGLTSASAGVLEEGILGEVTTGALADHALSNIQNVDSDELTSEVYGAFAIDSTVDTAINESTLIVTGNKQRSSAVANTAQSELTVGGDQTAAVSTGSALASTQTGDAAVSAISDVEVFAAAAVTNSTVSLSGNGNTAVGVINDVTNTLTVEATNIAPVNSAEAASLAGDTDTQLARGDHVLANRQVAETSVDSTASTALYNDDEIATTSSGAVNSTVRIADNKTAAEASANRALNTVSVNGAATQGANTGLANAQLSSADVVANSTASARLTLAGDPGDPEALPTPLPATPALDRSSVAISGNVTTALARGNSASNALNMSAGSSYNEVVGAVATTSAGTPSVEATAAVLNNQANNGNVTASSTAATYEVALNATTTTPSISNGSVAITGNQVAAEAYGNTASNRVTLTALNTGSPTAAVGNYQLNTGVIRAAATSVSFGVTGVGAVANSNLQTVGNQVAATAVGNSAVTTIMAGR